MKVENIDIIETGEYPHQLTIYLIKDFRMLLERMKQMELQKLDYPNGNDEYIEVTDELLSTYSKFADHIELKLSEYAKLYKWLSDDKAKRLAQQKANTLLTILTSLRKSMEELYKKAMWHFYEYWNMS